MKNYTAKKGFAIVGVNGSIVYVEGQSVPEDIATRYPQFINGLAQAEKVVPHNPKLKAKPTKREVAKMSEETMRQWIQQFHPGAMPGAEAKKDELAEIILSYID